MLIMKLLRGLTLSVLFAALVVSANAQNFIRPATAPSQKRTAVIGISGMIDFMTERYLVKGVESAKAAGAQAIIIKFNTPGGVVEPTLRMTAFLRERVHLPTIAYVEDRSLSAGAIMAVACDYIVMERGSQIGDAAPIVMGQSLGDAERAKAVSPIAADLDASATRNAHDKLLLEALIIPQRIVYHVQDPQGHRRFVGTEDFTRLSAEGWKTVPGAHEPVDGAETLLTLDARQAQVVGLSRGTYDSLDQFAAEAGLQIVSRENPSWGMVAIQYLGHPILMGFILTIFLQTLYMSISHPGHGMPEVICLVTLSILVGVPLMTGYATWWEIAMILIGIVLLGVEIFVLPGFGVAGITGIVLVLGGLLLTFVAQEPHFPGILPQLPQTWYQLKRGVIVVTAGLGCSLFLWFWLQRYLPKMPYFNKLILTATSGGEGLGVPVMAHEPVKVWPPVGATGTAITDLKPGGSAEFEDPAIGTTRVTDVLSDSGYLKPGETVIVKENVGMRIVVRKH